MTTNDTSQQQQQQQSMLPETVIRDLQAGAFDSLCRHLQERSSQVSNMDLMTLSGFCRNCLAKWMVLEARRLVDIAAAPASSANDDDTIHAQHPYADALNRFGYDEAAQIVYGMQYGDWKKRFQTKASAEQMQRYDNSRELWAQHDDSLLQPRESEGGESMTTEGRESALKGTSGAATSDALQRIKEKPPLASNVCCETVPPPSLTVHAAATPQPVAQSQTSSSSRTMPPYTPPSIAGHDWKHSTIRIYILTISDRAFNEQYKSGDLSGPAVQEATRQILGVDRVSSNITIVPDHMEAIQSQLTTWCDAPQQDVSDAALLPPPHIILTTGGTGMSARDVTPEATRNILHRESSGLMGFVSMECSRQQPLASLSRGTAGLRHDTFIANLPGNPKAANEVLTILLPLLVHGLDL